MGNMIKNLIVKLYERKWTEEVLFEMYKAEESHELMLISSGKIIEVELLIQELNEFIKNKSKSKKLQQ